jgi:hypothetical protein
MIVSVADVFDALHPSSIVHRPSSTMDDRRWTIFARTEEVWRPTASSPSWGDYPRAVVGV